MPLHHRIAVRSATMAALSRPTVSTASSASFPSCSSAAAAAAPRSLILAPAIPSNASSTRLRPYSSARSSRRAPLHRHTYAPWLYTAAAIGTALAYGYAAAAPVHAEPSNLPPSLPPSLPPTAPVALSQQDQMRLRAQTQGVYAWGSNRYNVVAPDAPQTTLVRTPRSIPFFDGVALRDIVLEEKHAVAVDANGDVLQWGLGFFDASARSPQLAAAAAVEDIPLGRRREKSYANATAPLGSLASLPLQPIRTLTGKNIVKVAATDERVYALSKDGKVYAFSAIEEQQRPRRKADWSANPLSLFGVLARSTIDYEVLTPAPSSPFRSGEKVADIAAGEHHLLALSNKGRTFAMPVDAEGNAYGQLGMRRVLLNSPGTTDTKPGLAEAVLDPKMFAELEREDGRAVASLMPSSLLPAPSSETGKTSKPPSPGSAVQTSTDAAPPPRPLTQGAHSIRYCTTLHEVPALRNLQIAQIVAGSSHSLARTADGRVLGWGRHTHGQLGLGSSVAIECVPVPSEVVLSRAFPQSSTHVRVTDMAAGGDNSFFMTSRREATAGAATTGMAGGLGLEKIDLLAVGKGQWGTLGNAMWSQIAAQPGRVKTVSGLMEYSEATQKTHPVPIHSLSVGKPGHCALVLDTVESAGHAAFGRDVMVWGANAAFQLGTGKRANLAVPQHLKPLPPPTPSAGSLPPSSSPAAAAEALPTAAAAKPDAKQREADLQSGALTHMPHKRLQLKGTTRADTRTPPDDAGRRQTKRGVHVEERIVAGAVGSAVFWRVEA